MGGEGDIFTGHKAHRDKSKSKKKKDDRKKGSKFPEGMDPKLRNPKAFAINSAVRAERKFRRTQDHDTKKDRVPLVDRTPVSLPPFVVAIVGPPRVGKSTLLSNLVKNYTRQGLSEVKGPVTIVTGKKRRLTFIECNNDIHSMIDTAKVADLVLLLVDASFGFEMEVFEFLNICQVHGFPQIMGVLTHLDVIRNKKTLKKTKKTLKHRFWTEVYPGAKLFYLSGHFPMNNSYPKNEIHNLARFISVMKFRPTVWRSEHAYVVADRMEDLTSAEETRLNPQIDRHLSLYGWIHGTNLKAHVSVHIPGLGDFTPDSISALPDPCPLPMKEKKHHRSLNEKEKVMYAPFSGVGGIVYDRDAVYIDLAGSHSHQKSRGGMAVGDKKGEEGGFVGDLRDLKTALNEKMESAGLQLFTQSEMLTNSDVLGPSMVVESEDDDDSEGEVEHEEEEEEDMTRKNFTSVTASDGRVRRKVIFDEEKQNVGTFSNANAKSSDDVADEIENEIRNLNRQSKKALADPDGRRRSEDSDSSDEEEEEEEEESEKDEEDNNDPSDDDEEEPVPEIQSKKQKKRMEVSVSPPTMLQQQMRPSKPDSSSEEDEDEDMEEDKGDDDDLEEEGDDDDEALDDVDSNDDEEEEATAKETRMNEAKEAFYSRFRNRPLQKMIYDDSEDYLNVTSRADFDVANHVMESEQIDIDTDNTEALQDLFVGGDYAETAKNILDADDEFGDEDEDMFGDFEELDSSGLEAKKKSKSGGRDSEELTESREDMKKKLKEKFDMEYDEGGSKSFYKEWKAAVEDQAKINNTFFQDVEDPDLLRDLQGYSPGTYVRIEIRRVPCEFVINFDPQRCSPLILGSLDSPNQETLAVVQARVKKHRWHPKILKTRDPVIMSIGWRRFQTIALYSMQDHNLRNRAIKYTPDHLHCVANFYGPMTPQGTGILGIAPPDFQGFRITFTGTILDMDKSTELVKKLKLLGHPAKIFKKSAFIEGMFSSQLEVAKFVGAKIKTVSGVRGVIKKELRTPEGAFRATFEDKIMLSDIVFCRTWASVQVPKFFVNLPTLITSQPRLMKTVGQLKRERGIRIEPNPDHQYLPVERENQKALRPLKIPKRLQDKLPFKEKPKVLAKLNAPKRIAVIKDVHERQMSTFLNKLKTRMSEREAAEAVEKGKKATIRERLMKKEEKRQGQREKELRKKVFRTLGQISKRAEASANSNSRGGKGGKHRRK